MTESETSPLLRHNGARDVTMTTLHEPARHRGSATRKLVFVCLAGICIAWMALQKSRTFAAIESPSTGGQYENHEESSRFDFDSFIHAFEQENTKHISFHHHNLHHDEGKLDHLLYFNRTSAYEDLVTDKESSSIDFFNYVQGGWDAQINQGYCPIASSAAIINSLRNIITPPQDPMYIPFPWATQQQLINNDCVRQTVYDADDPNTIWVGLGLDMARDVLNCHLSDQGYVAEAYHVNPDKFSRDKVRKLMKEAIVDEKSRVMINYDRGGIGQGAMGHGHFSPIGAYNYDMDAFLIMDVAKYKYPPVWVPASNLYHGVGSLDFCASVQYPEDGSIDINQVTNYTELSIALNCQPDYRGFVVVKPKH